MMRRALFATALVFSAAVASHSFAAATAPKSIGCYVEPNVVPGASPCKPIDYAVLKFRDKVELPPCFKGAIKRGNAAPGSAACDKNKPMKVY